MGISEFYDNVVLRDFLEYTAPGAVVLSAFGLVLEALNIALGLGKSPILFAFGHPWPALILSVFPAYVIGHVLTAVRDWGGHKGEQKIAVEVLGKNKWLQERAVGVIARDLQITEKDSRALLESSADAETLREIARGVIHSRAFSLYREFVGRHSILSRFCQNMVVAIGIFAWFSCLSVWILWDKLSAKLQLANQWPLWLVLISFAASGILAMRGLSQRSVKLRQTMAKHTFQIWCIMSVEDRLKADAAEVAKSVKGKSRLILQPNPYKTPGRQGVEAP